MTKASKLERLRYVEVFWSIMTDDKEPPNAMTIYRLIGYHIRELYGLKGSVETGIYLVSEKDDTNRMIIRCSHNHVDKLLAAIAVCDNYHNQKLIIYSKRISGILNKLKKG